MDFSVPSHFCVGYSCQFPVVLSESSVTQSLAQSNEVYISTRVFNINITECMSITMKICQISNSFKLIEFDLIIEDQDKQDIVFFHLYFSRTEYYSKGNLAELYLYWNESTIAFISARELYISSYLSRHLKCLGKQEKSL